MTPPPPQHVVVVGVADDDADAVLLVAAEFAAQFDADLVAVVVDAAHHAERGAGGGTVLVPIDPDGVDDPVDPADAADRLHEVLDRVTTRWSVRVVTGEASAGLAAVADEVDALMIVIGTRRRTVRRSLREFFAGSVAAHLAHRQARPVLVVPLDPAPQDDGLPWHDAEDGR